MRPFAPAAGLALTAALAAFFGAYYWVLRTPPPTSCADRAPQDAVDAYRAAAIPLHLLALGILAGVAAQMSRLRTGGPVGRPTTFALAGAGVLAAICLGAHDAFAYVALPGLVALALVGPLAVLAAVAASLWALASRVRRVPRPGPDLTAAVAWAAIFLAVPGHLALVLLQGEPLFCF